jgi:hypothetical protein
MAMSRYKPTGEWLKLLTYELADVAGIAGEGALVQLAAVPGMDEELDGTAQGVDGPREAARAAAQARQVMAQRGIVGLDAVGLALARCNGVVPRIVDQRLLSGEGVGVGLPGRLCALDGLLQHLPRALPDHCPAHDAAGRPIHCGHDVAGVFLWPMKV